MLANQCDLLVAADNTTFLYPEAKVGFSGGLISSLAVRIPHKVAMAGTWEARFVIDRGSTRVSARCPHAAID